MADNKVNFLRGTSTEYEASTKDNDTFYYTTDDGKLYLGNKEITNGGVTIDDTLSDTSKNPVQNKVINAALNNKAEVTDIPDKLPADGGNADTVDGKHASDFALSDDNYWLYTFSEAGNKHGASHRIYAKYNVKNDSRFYLQDEDTHHVRVNYADEAYTVNGHTVNANVPAGAVFTDTKVTSVANHYTPSADSKASLSASASGATAAWGIDVVKGVTLSRDAKGHVTGVSVTSGKIPANPNTDTKVTNTLATTTKAYVTGTTSSSTNTGTQVFDTGVYLDTTAGQIVAKTFKGALSGNASTATALTSSAGTAHIPVRFSSGKPVAVSEILKYNTGVLSHGDNTISYASGYKYALILLYCFKALHDVSGSVLQPVILTWYHDLSSTTSYGTKTISQSNGGQNDVKLTVSNGDLIININGASYYRYWIMWSN